MATAAPASTSTIFDSCISVSAPTCSSKWKQWNQVISRLLCCQWPIRTINNFRNNCISNEVPYTPISTTTTLLNEMLPTMMIVTSELPLEECAIQLLLRTFVRNNLTVMCYLSSSIKEYQPTHSSENLAFYLLNPTSWVKCNAAQQLHTDVLQ